MKKKLICILLIFTLPLILKSQKISIVSSHDANKEYVFIINKGINQDTIKQGKLSFTGNATINIPSGYKGIGIFKVSDSNTSLNLIVGDEDFSVEQDSEGKLTFRNSVENTYLHSIIQGEKPSVQNTSLYASRFVDLIHYLHQLKNVSVSTDLNEKAKVRLYALNDLDYEVLFTSGIWYNVIDGIVKLNTDQEIMGQDMTRILGRIKSQEIFEHLAENLVIITEQYGLDDAFDIIVPYIEETGRIKVPVGRIFTAFALAKVRRGTNAPPLIGLEPALDKSDASKTLLVFYESECNNCLKQLNELIKIYPKLNQMGIRVVSISSDHQKEAFQEDIARFPWPDSDKLCDYKGFAGDNYLNYGIMSTPTFFLLDCNQKVISRYALIADIDF